MAGRCLAGDKNSRGTRVEEIAAGYPLRSDPRFEKIVAFLALNQVASSGQFSLSNHTVTDPSFLLVTQCNHWIDTRRASCRDEAGSECNNCEQSCDREIDRRIERVDLEKDVV